MSIDGLFESESNIIKHGEKILQSDIAADNPLADEYELLLKNYKKMFKQLCRMVKINDRQQSRLSQANTVLEIHSKHDPLTGIFNRRAFNELYEREWRRSIRYGHIMSILMFDIDRFKSVNDRYGHQAGDDILKHTARVIADNARREGDLAARFGGEEFILLLPDTPEKNAFNIAENIRKAVARMSFHFDGQDVSITISAGLSSIVPDNNSDPEHLIRRADEGLYLAKRSGRNRVCIYDDLRAGGSDHA